MPAPHDPPPDTPGAAAADATPSEPTTGDAVGQPSGGDGRPAAGRRPPSTRGSGSSSGAFLVNALLVAWLLFPLVLVGRLAQDAVPYLVAGELAEQGSHDVYASTGGDLFTLNPTFARRSCELSPEGTDCANLNVAFVSPPIALPLAWLLSRFGAVGGVLLLRLVGAAMLAGGMWILVGRLRARAPDATNLLAVTVLLVTPFVMVPLALGQTSPILFLSAALGVRASERSPKLAAGASLLWVLAVALKVWPAALVLLLLWQRRWRFLAWSVGWGAVLLALSLPFRPFGLLGDFLRTSSELNTTAAVNPYNGAIEALVYNIWSPLAEGGAATAIFVARLVLVGGLAWWGLRRAEADVQWSFGYLALLALVPLVWWHYLWVALAALMTTLAARPRLGRERIVLPIAAVVTFPISLPNANGSSWPIPQGLFLLAALVLVAWLARNEPWPGERAVGRSRATPAAEPG